MNEARAAPKIDSSINGCPCAIDIWIGYLVNTNYMLIST